MTRSLRDRLRLAPARGGAPARARRRGGALPTRARGHSDADVLAHAVIDALLGAAGLGDIGVHFPDTRRALARRRQHRAPRRGEGAAGRAAARARERRHGRDVRGAEARPVPRSDARAPRCGAGPGFRRDVSVKFTTGEGMGFVGRGEGIAALATVSVASRAPARLIGIQSRPRWTATTSHSRAWSLSRGWCARARSPHASWWSLPRPHRAPRPGAERVPDRDAAERALADADQADARRGAGDDRPLLGVPIAVKDTEDVAGEVTRWGTAAFSEPAARDGELASRACGAAGAVVIGKTNLPELAIIGCTEGPAFGSRAIPGTWTPRRAARAAAARRPWPPASPPRPPHPTAAARSASRRPTAGWWDSSRSATGSRWRRSPSIGTG